MNNTFNTNRGSVLVGTIMLALLAASVIGGYLQMSLTEYKLSHRTLILQSAMNLAEAGLEEAMDRINSDPQDWTGWTAVGSDGYYKDVSGISFFDSREGRFRVYVEDYDELPILAAEGQIIDAAGNTTAKQIRVDLKRGTDGTMVANTIDFVGNITVDGYDSTLGPYNYTLNRSDQVTVAALSIDNGAADAGNADILGYVATGGGTIDVGAAGSIQGFTSTERVDPGRISNDFEMTVLDVVAPTGTVKGVDYSVDFTTLAPGWIGSTGTTDNPEVYHLSSFSMNAGNELDVVGPTVIIVDGDFKIGGHAGVNIWEEDAADSLKNKDGTLQIFAAGDVALLGNGFINDSLDPTAFKLWGTAPTGGGGQLLDLKGNGNTGSVVYAPNADVHFTGNADMYGAIIGDTLKLDGNVDFHGDVNLDIFDSFSIDRWRELRGLGERLDFSDRAALAAAIEPL